MSECSCKFESCLGHIEEQSKSSLLTTVLDTFVRSLFFLLLLFTGTFLHSQDTLYLATSEHSRSFTYNGDDDPSNYKNHMLRDLSLTLKIPLRELGFSINYEHSAILIEYPGETYTLINRIAGVTAEPFMYRDMDISGVMLPGRAGMLHSIRDTSGIEVRRVRTDCLLSDSVSGIYTAVDTFYLAEPFLVGDITAMEMEWTFSRKDYQRFREGVNQVDDYYAAGNLLDDLVGKYKHEFPADPGFMEQIANYLELKRVLRIIEQQENPGSKASGTAAEKLYQESASLAGRYMTRMKTLAEMKLREGYLPDSARMKEHASEIVDKHENYFFLAEETDHRYTTYYSSFATLGSVGESVSGPWRGLLPEDHDNFEAWTGRYQDLYLEGMVNSYLEKYFFYDSVQDYYRALTFLQNASKVYSRLYEPSFMIDFDGLFTQTERGMVNAYRRIIDRALEANNLYIADVYFKELTNRLKMSGGYPKFDTLLNIYSSELAYIYLERSGQLNFGGNAGEALVFLDMAEDLCTFEGLCLPDTLPAFRKNLDSLRAVDKSDKVLEYLGKGEVLRAEIELGDLRMLDAGQSLHRALYPLFAAAKSDYYVEIGDRYMLFDFHTGAIRAYVLATGFCNYLPDIRCGAINFKLAEAAKPFIAGILGRIDEDLAEFDYQGALDHYQRAEKYYEQFININDKELILLFAHKEQLIESSRCSEVDKAAERKYRQVLEYIQNGMHKEARKELEDLRMLLAANSDCHLDTANFESAGTAIEKLRGYAERLEALKAEDSAAMFVARSFELDRYYEDEAISAYNVSHVPTLNRVISSENPELLEALLARYSKTANDEESLAILWEMKDEGLKAKELKGYQAELGRRLAVSDFRVNPKKEPYISVNEYTRNYSFFKDFRRAYLDRWAELSGTERKTSYFWKKIKNLFNKNEK